MAVESVRTVGSRESALGVGASVLAAIGWGFAGIFAKLTTASALVLTFYRMWIGAAMLSAVVLLSGRRLTWRVLRASSLGGVLLCADMAMFFSAIKLTSVAVATVISALQPALVMSVAGPLLAERVSARDVAWTAVALGGVATVVVGAGVPTHGALVGDLLAVGSLFAWAAYFVVSKRARHDLNALEYTAGVTTVGAVSMTVVVLVSGQSVSQVQAGDWLWIMLLAIVPGSAHLLMNWAHRFMDASVSSVIGSANPIVAAGAGYVVLGQPLTALQIAGGLVGIGAVAVVAARRRQPLESPIE